VARAEGVQNRVLREQFGPEGEEINKGKGKNLVNEHLHDLHTSLKIIWVIKSGIM
jgi:hypothetical protein